jgi:hypothetical protein
MDDNDNLTNRDTHKRIIAMLANGAAQHRLAGRSSVDSIDGFDREQPEEALDELIAAGSWSSATTRTPANARPWLVHIRRAERGRVRHIGPLLYGPCQGRIAGLSMGMPRARHTR